MRTVESLSAEALSSRNADYIIANLRVKQAKPTKSMRVIHDIDMSYKKC